LEGVLILRDVLGVRASEVADMLDSTVVSVTSTLKRACTGLQSRLPQTADRERRPARDSRSEDATVAKFVRAWESADLGAPVALLTDNVFISMPPMPFEYEGHDAAARFYGGILRSGRRFDLVPTRANGQPAFGAYLRAPTGIRHGTGLFVLTLAGDRICVMTRFDSSTTVVALAWCRRPQQAGRPMPGSLGCGANDVTVTVIHSCSGIEASTWRNASSSMAFFDQGETPDSPRVVPHARPGLLRRPSAASWGITREPRGNRMIGSS
jgi:hypothetical protein